MRRPSMMMLDHPIPPDLPGAELEQIPLDFRHSLRA
jgi:hypothetical protein